MSASAVDDREPVIRDLARSRPAQEGVLRLVNGVLVLLVEDEGLIRMVLEEMLTEAGFILVSVANGQKAIAELESDAARFRAVVTDIRLGHGPDGWEVVRRARELAPAIPVVYLSGDNAYELASKGVPHSVMVPKPFVPAQVISAISTLLNVMNGHPPA